jgi:hypothetical protein
MSHVLPQIPPYGEPASPEKRKEKEKEEGETESNRENGDKQNGTESSVLRTEESDRKQVGREPEFDQIGTQEVDGIGQSASVRDLGVWGRWAREGPLGRAKRLGQRPERKRSLATKR